MSRRCVQCGVSLGVRAGIERAGKLFCNDDCAHRFFNPPDLRIQVVAEKNVFQGALADLKKRNPSISEPGILALYYLGWLRVPRRGTEDYDIYQKVKGWCKEEEP